MLPSWLIFVFSFLGAINLYVIFMLGRSAKKRDEHDECHKKLETRVFTLENQRISEERFRQIVREEFEKIELKLIKEGRLDA
jgi:hypothetical protein